MTRKQYEFKEYLLKRLGFNDEGFSSSLLESLAGIVGVYESIAYVPESYFENEKRKKYYDYDHTKEVYVPKKEFTTLDFLFWEYKFKQSKSFKVKNSKIGYVSGTDLANYTYCPVGYSIGKSFKTPNNILAEIGISKHKEQRLVPGTIITYGLSGEEIILDAPKYDSYQQRYEAIINEKNKAFFEDLDSSELLFTGHGDNSKQDYFINKEKKFVGQPDYIFKNNLGECFVVEEKFRKGKGEERLFFFRNHKVQLASYIYFLNTYKIKYGYLLYWFYNQSLDIYNCDVLRLNRSGDLELFLMDAYNSIKEINLKEKYEFDANWISPKKCGRCVYLMICGHKNRRFKYVSFPYSPEYFKLFSAEYPESLKQ